MRILTLFHSDRIKAERASPWMRVALGCVLLEISVLAGVLVSPILQGWMPSVLVRTQKPLARLSELRRAVYDQGLDPQEGALAPILDLRTSAGELVTLDSLKGREVAVVFDRDGNT
jgi:hypothetical protein